MTAKSSAREDIKRAEVLLQPPQKCRRRTAGFGGPSPEDGMLMNVSSWMSGRPDPAQIGIAVLAWTNGGIVCVDFRCQSAKREGLLVSCLTAAIDLPSRLMNIHDTYSMLSAIVAF